MKQRLKVYILLISILFIMAYIASEYYARRVDGEVDLYNRRLNILHNTEEVLYQVMSIQEGLYSYLYGTFKSPDFIKVSLKELDQRIENLSRETSYIIFTGKDDELFRTYFHHIEVIEVLYPKFAGKADAVTMARDWHEREMYIKGAIEAGEGLETLVKELHKSVEAEYERSGKSLPSIIERMRWIRNVTGLLFFISIVISSFIMFRSCKPLRRILPFLRSIKDGKYDLMVETDNDQCSTEIVSTFNTMIERIKEGENVSESLTIADPLTGAYNRRYFDMRVNEEMNRCIRYGTIFSLSIIDIDYFKEVNDSFGHQAGDSVLKELVMLIKENSRETDIVARYGGEEFAIIYPCTPKSGVVTQVERLRSVVEGHKFINLDKPLTISIGLADSAGKKESAQVIQEADISLYMAKSKGRNQCVIVGVTT